MYGLTPLSLCTTPPRFSGCGGSRGITLSGPTVNPGVYGNESYAGSRVVWITGQGRLFPYNLRDYSDQDYSQRCPNTLY